MVSICRLYVPPVNVNLPHYDDCDEDLSFSLQYSEVTTQHMSPPGHLGLAWCPAHLVLVWVTVRLQPHLDTAHSLSSSSVGRVGGSP